MPRVCATWELCHVTRHVTHVKKTWVISYMSMSHGKLGDTEWGCRGFVPRKNCVVSRVMSQVCVTCVCDMCDMCVVSCDIMSHVTRVKETCVMSYMSLSYSKLGDAEGFWCHVRVVSYRVSCHMCVTCVTCVLCRIASHVTHVPKDMRHVIHVTHNMTQFLRGTKDMRHVIQKTWGMSYMWWRRGFVPRKNWVILWVMSHVFKKTWGMSYMSMSHGKLGDAEGLYRGLWHVWHVCHVCCVVSRVMSHMLRRHESFHTCHTC